MTKEKSLSDDITEKIEFGEVFIATDKGLFPFEILKQAERRPRSKTKQIKEEQWASVHGLQPPPFSVQEFLTMQDNCGYFDACVRQIASDVIGQGWKLIPMKEGVTDEKEKEAVTTFLLDPNEDSDEDISDIVEKVIIDWGVIGWWAMEVERDNGKVIGIWHVPAHTIQVHKTQQKYCQSMGGKKQWFKKFGSEEKISGATGEPVKRSVKFAHEMIFGKRYYPQSSYYGVPAILPSVGSVFGLMGIRDYNLSFFENYGVPQALVTLTGRWKKESAKKISDFIDVEIKGSGNYHKTLVLKPPRDGDVKWTPLVTKADDAGFKVYIRILQQDVLSSYKMPPYRIGIAEVGSLGGGVAEEMTKIYGNSIVAPLKKTSGNTVTKKIMRQGLGAKTYRFEWNPLDTRDLDALTKRLQAQVGMGAITPSMAAVELGRPAYDAGDQYFVQSNYIPIGEESLEKREGTLTAELERLKGMVEEALEKGKQDAA